MAIGKRNPDKDEIIKAVFNIDVDTFKTMVGKGQFDKSYCQNTYIFNDVEFPLHYITICWDIIFNYLEEWKEEYKKTLRERKAKNDQLKAFFAEKMGLDMNADNITFSCFHNYFYCSYPDDDVDDCLWESVETLHKMGFTDIDIELAVNVEKFNFDEVERLLKAGADPSKDYSEDDENCFSRIYTEIQFIYSEFQDIVLGKSSKMDYEHRICYLIGLAAHEKMYHLLDPR